MCLMLELVWKILVIWHALALPPKMFDNILKLVIAMGGLISKNRPLIIL
jgi:hypothetical protein